MSQTKPEKNGFSVPEIEQGIVSAMMQWEPSRNEAILNLREEYFRDPANRALFRELSAQFDAGVPFELVAFTQHLRDRGVLESIGGAYYVTVTFADVCHSPNALPYYIDRLLQEHERWKLARVCTDSIVLAENGDETIVEDTIAAVSEIPVRRAKERTLQQAIDEKFERLQSGAPDDDIIRTGIAALDQRSPLRRGDMPLITGERKSGKSILALTIAANVAGAGLPVAYFSLEDREPKVFDRLFSGLSRIPLSVSHVNRMSPLEQSRAREALDRAAAMPLTIIDDCFDLSAIAARAKGLCARGTKLILIDYAQLIRVSGCESRRQEVEKVSRDLRLLAMETDCPVILLCQLNKDGETRETKALEMDCTAAWKIDLPPEQDAEFPEESNERFIRIPFQRNGESGISIKVTFLGNIARIENYHQA